MEQTKECIRQIAAGGSAGLAEICVMYPLDLVKTRLQMGGGVYSGFIDCISKTYQHESLSGFYKGILPPILAETPKRATKFFTFEQYKQIFTSSSVPQEVTFAFAGCLSGITEAVIINPFEVVKVRLQAERTTQLKDQKSTAQMTREIVKKDGIGFNGLYRGFTATLARHGIWNTVYFGIYHSFKGYLPKNEDGPYLNVFSRLILGFIAGSLASVANIPSDVAKSRIQGPQPNGQRVYFGLMQTMSLIYKTEGINALFRGLLAKVLRLGPGGGIMLIVNETVYDYLKEHF
ncbi:Mitochondrial 2-oxodicarboxylate carrier [Strongyloides ratti]|uniref:Mitochondrial 2-oxodicarboxylate carrier n=1 Tax=Strongyloides ratti TaxID=34506 RepID=A0A090L407_STRRB|nr:Mitochondrial 2-oxodicarboxylate carrier [Strongyloides ratti]CEF62179.1 Mitochondrial 2-oxodicarboxylate carrier [Strongyloides ratti]